MASLRGLLAQAESLSPNINNLRRRVQMQEDALATAQEDLRIALGREPSPLDPPSLPQPQPGGPRVLSPEEVKTTAEFILLAAARRRGEVPCAVPTVQTRPEPPKTTQGISHLAAAIVLAGKKARGERE